MRNFSLLISIAFVTLLTTCQVYQLPTEANTISYRMDRGQQAPTDHPVATLIAPYKTLLDEQMNTVIGESAQRLTKQKPESALGNWVADALQTHAKRLSRSIVNASIQNYGGLRIPEITAGTISLGKIYELMPFDNQLVIVEMNGRQVQQLFNHIAADGGWPVSSEVQFILRDNKAYKLTINRRLLISDQQYRIAMPDYIANGGGDCDFLQELPRENTGQFIRDLLIQEVQDLTAAGKTVDAKVTGRIAWSGDENE